LLFEVPGAVGVPVAARSGGGSFSGGGLGGGAASGALGGEALAAGAS
jgi:hypothetical protein